MQYATIAINILLNSYIIEVLQVYASRIITESLMYHHCLTLSERGGGDNKGVDPDTKVGGRIVV